MKDVEVEIKENVKISADFYKLSFFWDKEWGMPLAGNFCEIKVNNLTAPMLRRPFAFSGFDRSSQTAEIIYQKRGTATNILANKSGMKSTIETNKTEIIDDSGNNISEQFFVSFEDDVISEKIKILAPLGNSFYYTADIAEKKRVFAIAGGVGLGPILFAAKTSPFPVGIIAGFRTEDFVPGQDIFAGIKTAICTDDGSVGFKGNVVEFLETTDISSDDLIIACGPTPMLKSVHKFAAERNILCKVSLEEIMACGVGACMGCVCETKHGNKRVCKEGPVFDSSELVW
jgi:dihydroorotate dehydrogenase electron transfer subunit